MFDGQSPGPLARITTHCLLIETEQGLVLIDTGYGIQDIRHPHPRLPHIWRAVLNIRLHEQDTALHQIQALGFSANDVRHIVLTHLDFDHAGGLVDFPAARVHVLATEMVAARHRRSFVDRQRYRPQQWGGTAEWETYEGKGEAWFGFEAVRDMKGLPPEILMVPLRGHTLGHAGVAIRMEDAWLFHAGDAYLHHGQMNLQQPSCPIGMRLYQYIMDSDRPERRANQVRLRELKQRHGNDVHILCSHDTDELTAAIQRAHLCHMVSPAQSRPVFPAAQ